MVQLSNGGTAFSCRTWCGTLRRAEDLRNRRNGRRSIEENKGMYNCWSFRGIGAFLFSEVLNQDFKNYICSVLVYYVERMPLALKNKVANVASDKNKEKSCTKGSI